MLSSGIFRAANGKDVFTGTIYDSFLTNQSARSISVIL